MQWAVCLGRPPQSLVVLTAIYSSRVETCKLKYTPSANQSYTYLWKFFLKAIVLEDKQDHNVSPETLHCKLFNALCTLARISPLQH